MVKTAIYNKLFSIILALFLLSLNGCSGDINDKSASIEKKGESYLEKGEFQKAVNEYSAAIEIDKNNIRLYRSRAFAYILMGKYDQAIEDDQIALSLDPHNPDIHASIGMAFLSKSDIKSAIYHFSNGINFLESNSPHGSLIFWNRGIAYERIAECQNAIEDYKRSLESAPDYARSTIKDRIAWILATCPNKKVRDGVKALEIVTMESEKEMSHVEFRILAAAYAETGNYKKAIENQEIAINLLRQSKAENAPNREEKNRNLADYDKQLIAYKKNKPWRLGNQINN